MKERIIKYLFLDVDSTLSPLEGCDRLAEQKGIWNQIKEMTEATMNWTVWFDEIFDKKTRMVAPSLDELEHLWKAYVNSIDPFWKSFIQEIQLDGWQVWLITQGYKDAARILWSSLNISMSLTFGLEFTHDEDGNFLDFPEQPLKHEFWKSSILEQFTWSNTYVAYIWDGYWDMIAGRSADMFIWCGIYRTRKKVEKESPHFCSSLDRIKNVLQTEYASYETTQIIIS